MTQSREHAAAAAAAEAYFEPRRNPLARWQWKWNWFVGFTYGPIPVSLLIALPILIAVNL